MLAMLSAAMPFFVGLASGIAALIAVLFLGPRPRAQQHAPTAEILSEPRVFQFRNGYLTEHSDNVSFLLPSPIDNLTAWNDLRDSLSDIHRDASAALRTLDETGRPFKLTGTFGPDEVVILGCRDGLDLRVTVSAAGEQRSAVRIDLSSLQAMEDEIAMLSRANETSPVLSWAVDAEGRIVWCNAAYIAVVKRFVGSDAAHGWPLHPLFAEDDGLGPVRTRRKVRDGAGHEHWFEVTSPSVADNKLRLMHALSLDVVIKAEESLRGFISTLTTSLGFLPTGIAIFDRNGHLAVFNPALLDMTGLDGAWLSRRPRLEEFLDTLRDSGRMPEPRDYKAWRDAITKLGQAEKSVTFAETWTMPGNAAYRLTGRSQGDGAITLMLEDMTSDLATARTDRDRQNVLLGLFEDMSSAMTIFDTGGSLLLANAAAKSLWLDDESGELPDTLERCIRLWSAGTAPNAAWADLRSEARARGVRAEWSVVLDLRDGREVERAVKPMQKRRFSVTFHGIEGSGPATLSPAQARHALLA
ncbi:PAS domain-containing protein [uncultured Jannaschia sp.]|uniref:PAS domain-containing protein n=1 Tax=uncultured Jannaschia sp. TaxID=293347 RepID=UPI0026027382|nr:PAS domain-containing protein [uncultured Jannaschia sp.]